MQRKCLRRPEAELVCDVTIGEGEQIPPGVQFTKTWRLKNSGKERWPANSFLVHNRGERFRSSEMIPVPQLAAGEVRDISIQLHSPQELGTKHASWRLRTEHEYFSDEIWVIIEVSHGGMLAALQGMHGTSIAGAGAMSDFGSAAGFGGGVGGG